MKSYLEPKILSEQRGSGNVCFSIWEEVSTQRTCLHMCVCVDRHHVLPVRYSFSLSSRVQHTFILWPLLLTHGTRSFQRCHLPTEERCDVRLHFSHSTQADSFANLVHDCPVSVTGLTSMLFTSGYIKLGHALIVTA